MGNIASPNIIKASDINDLSINSLTTSGDVTCNGNLSVPSGSVTANQYYGKKFNYTLLLYNFPTNIPSTVTIANLENYEFLVFGAHGGNYTVVTLPVGALQYYMLSQYENIKVQKFGSSNSYVLFRYLGNSQFAYTNNNAEHVSFYIGGLR